MSFRKKKGLSFFAVCLVCALLLSACAGTKKASVLPANDVLSYVPYDTDKPIITIGMRLTTQTDTMTAALEEKFPEYNFVFVDIATGANSDLNLEMLLTHNAAPDIIISPRYWNTIPETYFADLSGEAFSGRYRSTILQGLGTEDGKLYCLPGPTNFFGILYNKALFAENGWQVPINRDEFIDLCAQIESTDIRPFLSNYKYALQVVSTLLAGSYEQTFRSLDDFAAYNDLVTGKTNKLWEGMDSYFALAKQLADENIIRADDFTLSMGANGVDFQEGKIAMFTDAATNQYMNKGYGILPFFGETQKENYLVSDVMYYLSTPKTNLADRTKKKAILDCLDYMSTQEYQTKLLGDMPTAYSSVEGMDFKPNDFFCEVADVIAEGRFISGATFKTVDDDNAILESIRNAVLSVVEGELEPRDARAKADAGIEASRDETKATAEPVVIAKAESDFTTLEVTEYIADKLKAATGAQIGVYLDRVYAHGNQACFFAGDITDRQAMRLYGKNSKKTDRLAVYEISGKNLKALLEKPYILGSYKEYMYAAAGLMVEYAPWGTYGQRLLKVTLADGTALADDTLYTVATWEGCVDERYINNTVKTYDDKTSFTDFMVEAITADGTIKPVSDGRLVLNWDVVADTQGKE